MNSTGKPEDDRRHRELHVSYPNWPTTSLRPRDVSFSNVYTVSSTLTARAGDGTMVSTRSRIEPFHRGATVGWTTIAKDRHPRPSR